MNDIKHIKEFISSCDNKWEEAAKNIINVCRIIIKSRYESEKQYPGSKAIRLDIIKKNCKLIQMKMEQFFSIIKFLAKLSEINEIHRLENTLAYYWIGYDKKYSSAPKIDIVLYNSLGKIIGNDIVFDYLMENIKHFYNLKYNRNIISQFQELSDKFNSIKEFYILRHDLFTNLGHDNYSTEKRNILYAFIELLEIQGSIRPFPWNIGKVHIHGPADPDYLIVTLFSTRTYINGLDYIFQGGILIPEKLGLCIVVSGPTGSGKTTLAINLASALARKRNLALYFSFEQNIQSLIDLIYSYNLDRDDLFSITNYSISQFNNMNQDAINRIINKDKGLILFRDLTKYSEVEIQERVLEYINYDYLSTFKRKIIVFDALNSIYNYGVGKSKWRNFINEFSDIIKNNNCSVIFIVENTQNKKDILEPFISDISIELDKKFIRNYKLRTIDILKARNQAIHRGTHQFSIVKNQGVEIYPSPAAVLATKRRRVFRLKTGEIPKISCGIVDFDKYLGSGWWIQGSCTALIGESGTLKSTFARSFIEQASKEKYYKVATLTLSFGTESSTESDIGQKKFQKHTKFGTIHEFTDKSQTLKDILYLFRIGYITSGQVLSEVQTLINENKWRGFPIHRVVIKDVDNISYQYPLLSNDEEFLPALTDLLLIEGATIILLCSIKKDEMETNIQKQVKSLSENILWFQHVYYSGYDYIGISIKKSVNSTHKKGIYQIEILKDKLVIKNTFDLMKNLRIGNPESISVNLALYSETILQKKYNEILNEMLEPIGINEVEIHLQKETLTYKRMPLEILPSRSQLNIVQIDNYKMDFMINNDVLIDLSEYDYGDWIKIFADSFTNNSINQSRKDNSIYGIPYYLNPSILCYRKEMLPNYDPNVHSWDTIYKIALEFKESGEKYSNYTIFDCPLESLENYNCVFLEILLSHFKKSENNNCLLKLIKTKVFNDSAILLRRLIGGKEILNKKTDKNNKQTLITVNEKAIFWRHWYSTLRQMIDNLLKSNIDHTNIVASPLPNYCSINGDWFMCIQKESAGIESGINIIKQLCSVQNAAERFIKGVGLPPQKKFYEGKQKNLSLPLSKSNLLTYKNIHECSILRSEWRCYPFISTILYQAIITILQLPYEMKKKNENKEIEKIKNIALSLFEATIPENLKYCPKGENNRCSFNKN